MKMKRHTNLKLLNQQKELEECTFKPNLKKEIMKQQRDPTD